MFLKIKEQVESAVSEQPEIVICVESSFIKHYYRALYPQSNGEIPCDLFNRVVK